VVGLVAVGLTLASAEVARSSSAGFGSNDFRLLAVHSSLGAPERSRIVMVGTLSRRAYDAGLRPNAHYTLSARVTCAPASNPTVTTTTVRSIDSQIGGFVATAPVTYRFLPLGIVTWTYTATFPAVPFDDFHAAVWCPASSEPQVLSGFTLVEAKGNSWLAAPGFSPEPGTTLYAFDAPSGTRIVFPHPA
jgi:hypothetical protein